jgi:hypothetical protein
MGLKSLIPPDPTGLLREYYKYISNDGRYYILATFIIRVDGSHVVDWSKYCYDNDGEEREGIVSRQEDFDAMLESEGYEESGHYTTCVK